MYTLKRLLVARAELLLHGKARSRRRTFKAERQLVGAIGAHCKPVTARTLPAARYAASFADAHLGSLLLRSMMKLKAVAPGGNTQPRRNAGGLVRPPLSQRDIIFGNKVIA
jgi:hypothetical protein